MTRKFCFVLTSVMTAALLAGCAGTAGPDLASRCSSGIEATSSEIQSSKAAKGDWAKATSLIAGAKIDRAFEEYGDCLDKVEQARAHIATAHGGLDVSSNSSAD